MSVANIMRCSLARRGHVKTVWDSRSGMRVETGRGGEDRQRAQIPPGPQWVVNSLFMVQHAPATASRQVHERRRSRWVVTVKHCPDSHDAAHRQRRGRPDASRVYQCRRGTHVLSGRSWASRCFSAQRSGSARSPIQDSRESGLGARPVSCAYSIRKLVHTYLRACRILAAAIEAQLPATTGMHASICAQRAWLHRIGSAP
ncbi:hypothetical protein PYCCODRAFT_930009 [Trametes coccinea BRFM310]|uniref:Uncharacterized protein n=1 Tax=Trametes coccinea (strain BRFM310) TaxID=1353009 RepID=A0A1Y2IZ48_TRAC3|nr:hypothetical protein PYCCODRAFT_930009 [Trametes coccinea BRFM310]